MLPAYVLVGSVVALQMRKQRMCPAKVTQLGRGRGSDPGRQGGFWLYHSLL